MIAVEEQAFERHALMRHIYGVHFAGNGMRTRSIHPDIGPAADQRGKRIRFDMKHERLRIDVGLRQGNLARSLQIRGGMPLFIRALRRINLSQRADGVGVRIVGRFLAEPFRRAFNRRIDLIDLQEHRTGAALDPIGVEPELFKQFHVPVGRDRIPTLRIRNA